MNGGNTTMGIKFEKGNNYHIPSTAEVKVTKYNNGKINITHVGNKSNNLSKYKRKSGNEFVDTETGKTRKYETTNYKTESSINRSIKQTIRPILENNFFGGPNELFVTLTFKENMEEFGELTRYFNNFWKRLCYKYSNLELACLYVKEFQQTRTSWHIHCLIKEVTGKTLYIPNNEMAKIWKYGFTKTSRVVAVCEYTYKLIDEENSMKQSLFIPNETWHIIKVIDYMCKLKTKNGKIPYKGRISGKKGNLSPPLITTAIYQDVYKTLLKDSEFLYENTLLIRNMKNNNIINYIHNENWLKNK